jgi:hypothetical protein
VLKALSLECGTHSVPWAAACVFDIETETMSDYYMLKCCGWPASSPASSSACAASLLRHPILFP